MVTKIPYSGDGQKAERVLRESQRTDLLQLFHDTNQ